MSEGRTNIGVGSPPHEGVYAVEIYFGWKLLEWHAGQWWFPDRTARWGADVPAQWVGPLPARKYGSKPKLEFDL